MPALRFISILLLSVVAKGQESGYSSSVHKETISSATSSKSSSSREGSKDDLHPAQRNYNDCQYVGDWGDCDPFKMIRVKEERLVIGSSSCLDRRNITKPCSRDDLPPGTTWLLKEHKLCVMELEKLKSMIDDLHRYIDLIHQRGQALFNSYNELKKRLMDLRREIEILGRRNHDAQQTITRLRKEVEDWKSKSNKMQMELNQLKAQYKGLEIKVRASKQKSEELTAKKTEISEEQNRNIVLLENLQAENRNLKTSVLDGERYNDELRGLQQINDDLEAKVQKTLREVNRSKKELNKCRLDLAMPTGKQGGPKINKDTKVNLDMSMWITHNVTVEEGEKYEPIIKYYEEPKYEEPKYEEPKYEEPKYEEPKYEEPKYEEPKYEEPKYEEPKYEEPKYEAPKYEEPKYEEPKYEEPKYEEPKYEEPKY